jgi:acyl-CoA reductase-like NAD-dependent aldehyde dehydrogenase
MKTSTASEVDRLLQVLRSPTPLTDEALVATVLNVLGQIAGDVTKLIEDAETAQQAFDRLAAVDIANILYRCATAFSSTRRVLELRAAARRAG